MARTQPDLADVTAMLETDTGLAEVITIRSNGRPLVSVVNAGTIDHPVTGESAIAFVSQGSASRLRHLERNPEITLIVRRGWVWTAIDGTAELAGPDHECDGIEPAGVPQLLRQIFRAAGGTHDDYDEYDRAMVEDRRCAVIVTATHIYSNRS